MAQIRRGLQRPIISGVIEPCDFTGINRWVIAQSVRPDVVAMTKDKLGLSLPDLDLTNARLAARQE
jgi:hypothetical protein